RTAENPNVDEMSITRQTPVPFDAGVSREYYIRLKFVRQILEEGCRSRGFPEKLVHLPRAAMAHKDSIIAQQNSPLLRQCPHPVSVSRPGVDKRVGVAEPCEMVVARIGVAALAIGEGIADRVVVISLYTLDVVVAEQRKDAVGTWTERAQISKAENVIDVSL